MVVRCTNCHGVYPKPFLLPTGNPYSLHSGDEYFWLIEPDAKRRSGRSLADFARQITGSSGRLLELGCGMGELLVGASEAGWSVRGVEMTEAFASRARDSGIDVETASVESCRSLDQRWECILLAAILEHLYDPRACLARVREALVPGGVTFIDVPNECSLWTRAGNGYMRLRRRGWAVNLSPTFPPYHVVGFCPRSLRWLLSDLGFEIVEIQTHRWPNALPKRGSLVGRLEALAAEATLSVGAWVGSGAGITAWARRP
jgi:SAM-dependent methyltransferase